VRLLRIVRKRAAPGGCELRANPDQAVI